MTKAGLYLMSRMRENVNTAQPYRRVAGGTRDIGVQPSLPGQFPHKLSGQLLKSITYKVDAAHSTLIVGSNLKGHPGFLQTGTRRMAPRPWVSLTWNREKAAVGKILVG